MAAKPEYDGDGDDGGDEDGRKAFLSRIPQMFDSDAVKRVMESEFGEGCVEDVAIVRERPPDDDDDDGGGERGGGGGGGGGGGKDGEHGHRGFGFVTFATRAHRDRAVGAGTARGPATPGSSRRRTMYVTAVVRDGNGGGGGGGGGGGAAPGGRDDACFLWKKGRCPYGEGCKFAHVGGGGCAPASASAAKKKKKTRSRREEGGEDEEGRLMGSSAASNDDVGGGKEKRDKSQVDCINYKNKGKCRKGADCPYRHDASALRGKSRAKGGGCVIIGGEGEGGGGDGHGDGDRTEEEEEPKRSKRGDRADKVRQSLSVRVFGLNYETTEKDVREYFAHCGKIMEVTFPTWEDSGRSKGYCGVLFTSPKAVEAAVLLDGNELHGRWLRVQEGKMYLKKWEEAENKKIDDDGRWESGGGSRKGAGADMGVGGGEEGRRPPPVGEYGQSVKKRKKHGFKE
jgi:hypothetical protein